MSEASYAWVFIHHWEQSSFLTTFHCSLFQFLVVRLCTHFIIARLEKEWIVNIPTKNLMPLKWFSDSPETILCVRGLFYLRVCGMFKFAIRWMPQDFVSTSISLSFKFWWVTHFRIQLCFDHDWRYFWEYWTSKVGWCVSFCSHCPYGIIHSFPQWRYSPSQSSLLFIF